MKNKDRAKNVIIHFIDQSIKSLHHKNVSIVSISNNTMIVIFNDEDKDDLYYDLKDVKQTSIQ